ncbi:Nif3-like dinuclear metal center hexameric protein [Spirosoma sordidisoli]|uniref:GTP cyclohydrolase 1 type 2 homolog n=1 Tax=Spirosoma sordidisoli TaxID=2502893 RepID=A0A4Q2UQM4_9BACT|nr:Nif3-like dinuclear metal center hexameric protein [Spirosoma sordidisoli]RYC69950.1 Nif3-like dinuclear metal center hexameric protein [Spirosoma sordidisoli]
MTTIRQLTAYLETIAPLAYQESYDNAGLIVGDPNTLITGVLVTLDATEAVIDEALARGCNLVVAHHPIVFRGLKKLNGKNYVERTVIKAIKNEVAIYASHTNLDNVAGGVNAKIAEKLGLQQVQILAPKAQTLSKLVVYTPDADLPAVLRAVYEAGAGRIGAYDHCSFRVGGTGTFRPLSGANPVVGAVDRDETVQEQRLEVLLPTHLEGAIVAAMKQAHSYEVPAYDLYALTNSNQTVGSGAVGNLPAPMTGADWLTYLKETMQLPLIRHTALPDRPIQRIAVCGGAGSFLLADALRAGADAFVTADYKYHEFFDAEGRLIICDIGHYESEVCTKELIGGLLAKKFTTFAVILSGIDTNPVQYFT